MGEVVPARTSPTLHPHPLPLFSVILFKSVPVQLALYKELITLSIVGYEASYFPNNGSSLTRAVFITGHTRDCQGNDDDYVSAQP